MSKSSILDTNVLVHFLLGDNETQKTKAIKWFREATNGEREIVVKPAIIAEAVYVLESYYGQSRNQIMASMFPFLAMPVLVVDERDVLLSLWNDYLSGLHFIDAYLLACSRAVNGDILSFDKQLLGKIKGE